MLFIRNRCRKDHKTESSRRAPYLINTRTTYSTGTSRTVYVMAWHFPASNSEIGLVHKLLCPFSPSQDILSEPFSRPICTTSSQDLSRPHYVFSLAGAQPQHPMAGNCFRDTDREAGLQDIAQKKPRVVIISPPCSHFSAWQRYNRTTVGDINPALPKDPKLWKFWYILFYGSCRIYIINSRYSSRKLARGCNAEVRGERWCRGCCAR